jgi:WD40 repeat protein
MQSINASSQYTYIHLYSSTESIQLRQLIIRCAFASHVLLLSGDRIEPVRSPALHLFTLPATPAVNIMAADQARSFAALRNTFEGHVAGARKRLTFSPDGSTVACVSGGEIKLWDIGSGTLRSTLSTTSGDDVHVIVFSPDGKLLRSASLGDGGGTVEVWDVRSGTRRTTFQYGTAAAGSGGGGAAAGAAAVRMAFLRDGRLGASIAEGDAVQVWDADSGALRHNFSFDAAPRADGDDGDNATHAPLPPLVFSDDGSLLAAGVWDFAVNVWSIATGSRVAVLQGHGSLVTSLAFSPCADSLAVSVWDRTVRLWKLPSGEEHRTLVGHTDLIRTVSFSPDGKLVASASYDRTVRLWDAAAGTLHGTLEGSLGLVDSVVFSPDGTTVAAASWTHVRLWDVRTCTPTATLAGDGAALMISVSFSPDGGLLAGASVGSSVRIWALSSERPSTSDSPAVIQSRYPIVVPDRSDLDYIFSTYWFPDGGDRLHAGRDAGPFVEMRQIRRWLRHCTENHGGSQHAGSDGQAKKSPFSCICVTGDGQGGPDWLIDVERRCIVRYSHDKRFVALSYVWGGVLTTQLENNNVNDLQRDHAIMEPAAVEQLPKTIRDAMFLVGFLGRRYLWCDRLCIVQDDPQSLAQVDRMGEIYARADCTVMALTNQDADAGLPGTPYIAARDVPSLRDISSRRRNVWSHIPRQRALPTPEAAEAKEMKWKTRGWTFQEAIFSVRKIKVLEKACLWECSPLHPFGHDRAEDHSLTRRNDDDVGKQELVRLQVGGLTYDPWPNLAHYQRLVGEYNHRLLTRGEDALRAFAGALSVLDRSFPGGFIQGLPAMCFDECLLWQPDSVVRRRRQGDDGGHSPQHGMDVPPSWSWAGWQCKIDFKFWPNSYPDSSTRLRPLPWRSRTTAIFQWSGSAEIESIRRPLTASKKLRSIPCGDSDVLPPGWSRHTVIDRPEVLFSLQHTKHGDSTKPPTWSGTIFPDQPKIVYRHEDFGDQDFTFPYPTSGVSGYSSFVPRFLHCQTRRANFLVDKVVNLKERRFAVLTTCRERDWAGVLRLNVNDASLPEQVEMVAISSGWIYLTMYRRGIPMSEREDEELKRYEYEEVCLTSRRAPLLHLDRQYRWGEKYEFYNLLWIEWEKGIAFRRGLGRIAMDVWKREAQDFVDLTLG